MPAMKMRYLAATLALGACFTPGCGSSGGGSSFTSDGGGAGLAGSSASGGGRPSRIAPRVAGQVTRVLVDDNQRVKRGDLLVQLDKEPYEVRVAIRRAALGAAE